MDKKGISYVDWVISLGIFLVFTLTIFVLFKPHVIDDYGTEYLISIAEQGIREEGYYGIDNYPLFVKNEGEFTINPTVDWIVFSSTRFVGFDESKMNVLSSDLSVARPFDLVSDTLYFQSDISVVPGLEVYGFNVLLSEEELGGVVEDHGYQLYYCSDEDLNCVLGVVEKLKGFSEQKIYDHLFSCDDDTGIGCCETIDEYDNFKELISYPNIKDLSVEVEGLSVTYECNYAQPLESDNVFVLNWNDNVLNNNGTKTPIKIEVKVW